jgi:Protein of unknown function (DUF2924)
MVKLTDSQLIVLSKAAAREDGAAVVPLRMNKAAAVKIGSSLIGRKLMREIKSKPGMPVWREDENGRPMSLVVTRAGRDAIGINEPDETYLPVPSKSGDAERAHPYLAGAAPRPGSKQALVIGDAVEGPWRDVGRPDRSNRLAAPYDAGGLDGSSEARLCSRADPRRDQGLALPDCAWSQRQVGLHSGVTDMPRPPFDRDTIEAEIDRLRSLDLDALRTLWRSTFRSPRPPAFTRDLMARFLCWHIQEQAHGGLDPEIAKHLDGRARGDKSGADRPRRLKPGSVLLREYQRTRPNGWVGVVLDR